MPNQENVPDQVDEPRSLSKVSRILTGSAMALLAILLSLLAGTLISDAFGAREILGLPYNKLIYYVLVAFLAVTIARLLLYIMGGILRIAQVKPVGLMTRIVGIVSGLFFLFLFFYIQGLLAGIHG